MGKLSFIVLGVVVALLSGACEKKTEGTLVMVGDESITESDLDLLAKVNPRLQRRLASEAGRKQVLDNYVEQELLSQEARKRGLDNDQAVKAKIDLYKKVILAQSLLEDELNRAAKEYYDNNSSEFEKIEMAHIYIPFKTQKDNPALAKDVKVSRTQEQAKKRIAEAKAKLSKQDFASVVAEYSEDGRTKDKEGDLGWVGRDDARLKRWDWLSIVDTAFTLKPGEISEPIQTSGGYHLVLVKQPVKKDDFDQVEARIRFSIQQQVKGELVSSLREDYAVEFVEPETLPVEREADPGATQQDPASSAPDKNVVPVEEAAQAQ